MGQRHRLVQQEPELHSLRGGFPDRRRGEKDEQQSGVRGILGHGGVRDGTKLLQSLLLLGLPVGDRGRVFQGPQILRESSGKEVRPRIYQLETGTVAHFDTGQGQRGDVVVRILRSRRTPRNRDVEDAQAQHPGRGRHRAPGSQQSQKDRGLRSAREDGTDQAQL